MKNLIFFMILITGCNQQNFNENELEFKDNLLYQKKSKTPFTGKLILKYNNEKTIHRCYYINGELENIEIFIN